MSVLDRLDDESVIELIDTAYNYLMDKKSVPIKKLSPTVRVPFSVIHTFLKRNPEKQIKELEGMKLSSKKVIQALRAKVYLMYAQNFTQVGLLSNYGSEMERITEKKNAVTAAGAPLNYVGC